MTGDERTQGARRAVDCGNPIGLHLTKADVDRWERQIATPYAELSEAEKNSDREQVDRYWPLVSYSVALRQAFEELVEAVMLCNGGEGCGHTHEHLAAALTRVRVAKEGT